MTILAAAILVAAVLWFVDRRDHRTGVARAADQDRALAALRVQADQSHAATVAAQVQSRAYMAQVDRSLRIHADTIATLATADREHREHVDRLVQRIQAPDVAVAQHAAFDLDAPFKQFVGFDNDEEFLADQTAEPVEEAPMDWRDFLTDRANAV